MKTFVYIDGFNLYYRALKNNGLGMKWLNLDKFVKKLLPNNDIVLINYYTARVSSRSNPNSPKNQQVFFNALGTLSNVKIHLGQFLVHSIWAYINQPPEFRPPVQNIKSRLVKILKTEEKGSDVNMASHLVRDAFLGSFECAAILTNDTDLVEPIRIVTNEVKLPIILLSPDLKNNPAQKLIDVATSVRRIRKSHITLSQFPDIITNGNKIITKPSTW
jgi:uncharacterized LabA/DUF88 family protein